MSINITNIEIPSSQNEWGIVQINNLSKTYFRFEIIEGDPKLDTSLFSENEADENKKYKKLSPETTLYKNVQKALVDYFLTNQQ